jgi:hypothetical protein
MGQLVTHILPRKPGLNFGVLGTKQALLAPVLLDLLIGGRDLGRRVPSRVLGEHLLSGQTRVLDDVPYDVIDPKHLTGVDIK